MSDDRAGARAAAVLAGLDRAHQSADLARVPKAAAGTDQAAGLRQATPRRPRSAPADAADYASADSADYASADSQPTAAGEADFTAVSIESLRHVLDGLRGLS